MDKVLVLDASYDSKGAAEAGHETIKARYREVEVSHAVGVTEASE